MRTTTDRRVLLPLASIMGAGVLAVALGFPGSGASAASDDGVRLTATDDDGAALVVTAIEPGDSVTRSVTITNTTGAEARLSFTEHGGPATYGGGALGLVIEHGDRELYDGPFGGMGDFAQDMGFLAVGESSTFSFTVSLPEEAEFVPAGAETAEATYSWLTVTP